MKFYSSCRLQEQIKISVGTQIKFKKEYTVDILVIFKDTSTNILYNSAKLEGQKCA